MATCCITREEILALMAFNKYVKYYFSCVADPFQFEDPASVLVIYCHANGEDIGVLYEVWICIVQIGQ